MVCMGNICRSPLAHGVFERMVDEAELSHLIEVDSSGTHSWHAGNLPDPRSQEVAMRHGLDLSYQRARKVIPEDLDNFDYIIAMDRDNLEILQALAESEEALNKLSLFLDFADGIELSEVPDPYYGGPQGFDHVYELVEAAASGLLQSISQRFPKA
ncbi:MAG: low molecular weight phosphotyrosine protein phosphatase [Gammaproteobacteria bacterium]|nr:low molecular weight phosphotyrosine protein phosphatase [Gammaproteobacteria bacterium]